MRRIAILIASLTPSLPAVAAPVEELITSLQLKTCDVIHTARQTDDGRVVRRKDRTPDSWRCKGAGGWFVFITEGDLRPVIGFSPEPRFEGTFHGFPRFGVTVPRVEWRGMTVTGQFRPKAAIVRFEWRDERGRGAVLGVVRLHRDPDQTCVFAYVDANANPDANRIADRLADEKAPSARCPTDAPAFVGRVSALWK